MRHAHAFHPASHRFPVPVLFLLILLAMNGCAGTQKTGFDTFWGKDDKDAYAPVPRYEGFARTSQYLTMRDGVRIAMDVFLPAELAPDEKIPAILMQTRYFRRFHAYRPFQRTLNMDKEILRVAGQGYALVRLDVRGTGASFGNRTCPWSEDEIMDGVEVVDWIINQPWSNGKIGALGGSYEGTAAELLLCARHPAVKAVAPMFSLYDVYEDIILPGGIHLEWFTRVWGKRTASMDKNRLGEVVWYAPLFTKGVAKVDGDRGRKLLRQAVKEHQDNYRVHREASQITFRDDVSKEGLYLDSFSPHSYLKEIRGSGAAIYSYSGWFDGGYSHAAIKRYLTVGGPKDKLTLGPWDHGGAHHVLPLNGTLEADFNHLGELIRFLDFHLKGIDTGIYDEPPVQYYTMGENRWKSADTWPPPGAIPIPLYLSSDHTLSTSLPTESESDEYRVDLSAGTGQTTRWRCLAEPIAVSYPDRKERDRKLLVYETGPLDRNMEVTGHPVVTLYLDSSMTDAQVFVYLEDVDEKGRVGYITEGMLRATHRKLSKEEPPYKIPAPYRTFLRKESRPLVPGEVAELTFGLLPVSHLFKKGHRIRIAIAGADADLFEPLHGEPPVIHLHRGAEHPSHISLPVMPEE